jgi:NAD(P)-dependent dehydrogenase (short-subunit alcohol dehydrogenase family)
MSTASDYKPNFDLTGSVMLVTGPARGLGRASTLACAAAGADIILGLRDKGSDGGLAAEIEKIGRKVLPLQLDVTKLDQIKAGVAQALDRFGRIDILLNNVGVGPENPAEKVTEADFDFTLNANLKGTFFVTQAVAKTMIQRKKGRIINMSSQAGTIALRGEPIYCMSKAAIDHLTRCLAHEWGRYNICVNAVAPTFIWTDGTRPALSDPEFLKQTVGKIPLGRIGEPKEVAGAVVFLASPAASLVNGTILHVDGGWTTG